MAANAACEPSWVPTFLAVLSETGAVRRAARTAGIVPSTAYGRRVRHRQFDEAWQAALAGGGGRGDGAQPGDASRLPQGWRAQFLEALAETSNVSASAARAQVPTRTAYKLKRDDPQFAAKWLVALHEGYDNLEMELLGYLRDPQGKPKMDVAAAMRLLVAHRETVARERALREDDDEQAVLDSIDAFIEDMRQRRAANAAILLEDRTETEATDGAD